MAEDATNNVLTRVVVRGLFGYRRVDFRLDAHEPTILTGSNGAGKSTVLRMIDAFCTGKWEVLRKLPFEELTMYFADTPPVRVKRNDGDLTVGSRGMKTWKAMPVPDELLRRLWTRESMRMPHPPSFEDFEASLNYDELLLRAAASDRFLYRHRLASAETPDRPSWLEELAGRVPVLFVTDQRLVIEATVRERRDRGPETTLRVADEAVEHVRKLMVDSLSEYAAVSQRLDRDFPQRVVAAMRRGVDISDDDLAQQLRDNEAQALALEKVGLLPEGAPTGVFTDFGSQNEKPVVATNAADTGRKLAVLSSLRHRLSLFGEFLSQHYRTKSVVFDPQAGFYLSAPGTKQLAPRELSSGEQQMLVLAYQILFKAEPGTLVLIDEPELSLHVIWQSSFVDDITRMGTERNLRFLLATHSPTLLGGREDLRRSLDQAPPE
jgi:ABC-type transport system involved in cytochrome c biogenesis ATPase subunit